MVLVKTFGLPSSVQVAEPHDVTPATTNASCRLQTSGPPESPYSTKSFQYPFIQIFVETKIHLRFTKSELQLSSSPLIEISLIELKAA